VYGIAVLDQRLVTILEMTSLPHAWSAARRWSSFISPANISLILTSALGQKRPFGYSLLKNNAMADLSTSELWYNKGHYV
jgi:hypothetical protein